MKNPISIALALLVSCFSVHAADSTKTPILLELFTSEGCSSCPPADLLFSELLEAQPFDGVELIGVAQHVDYWNQLGWKDRFSSAEFSLRQRNYSQQLANDNRVYTPQMVVHGKLGEVGSQPEKVFDAIDAIRTELQSHPPEQLKFTLQRNGAGLVVKVVPAELRRLPGGDIVITIALVQDGISSRVKAGENNGRLLKHDAVAVAFRQAAVINNKPVGESLPLPSGNGDGPLRVVVIAQNRQSGRVLAVSQQPVI